jgi:hypothetical protein
MIVVTQPSLEGARSMSQNSIMQYKRIPVVQDYFCKGWDHRARNNEEQIVVCLDDIQGDLPRQIIRVSCSIALSAHYGYRPPFILVRTDRKPDCIVHNRHEKIPENIQDIFPMLNVLSLSPQTDIEKMFPYAQIIRGDVRRESKEFVEIDAIKSKTAILTGDWVSWKYTDDYLTATFGILEYHPSIYHHLLKTYPFFLDRSKPWNAIVLGKSRPDPHILNEFAKRSPRTVLFTQNPDFNLNEFTQDVFVLTQEPFQLVSYFAGLVGELLIDDDLGSWWSGLHATHRGRNVYYLPSENTGPHFYHPRWISITDVVE